MLEEPKAQVTGAKIVVIGGGTGSFVILSGLKNYAHDITALVNMADDGGSTGQLRDELGVLPPGDVRQCLVALSGSPRARDLFNYRFDEGSLAGHAFGNLFLAALEKMTGSMSAAIELADDVLNVEGQVIPITLDQITICLDHGGKEVLRHERNIDGATFVKQHPKFWLEPRPKVNKAAVEAIMAADIVVISPGSVYKSLAPALVVPGVGAALRKTTARKIYVCNLINKPGQTDNFKVHDLAAEMERLAGGKFLDYVIYNVHQPGKRLLEKYAAEGELPVEIDAAALKAAHYKAKGAELLAGEVWENQNKKDPLASQRTLIRHDPDAAARAIMKIYFS
ncbi:YvcK family protein [Candidatus Saccharibacteria bacterium]|nr:YvcK family protein [Candidatus Saccharibacteria bacterium]